MRGIVRGGLQAGALGLSVSKNRGHYDPQGVHIPAFWAEEAEMFALADVLSELGVGTIQSGGGRDAELDNRLMTRLAEACGRQVVYNNLGQSVRQPEAWKQHMALVDETAKAGIRANPLCTPNSNMTRFTMRNTQAFRGIPTWHPILLADDAEKLRAYSDPAVRHQLHQEVVEWVADLPGANLGRRWYDYIWVGETRLPRNQQWQGKSIREMAEAQGKGIIDAFLDLAVEEELETVFLEGSSNVDKAAMAQILTYPNAYIGLSDGGAHVQFHGGYGYSTRLLGYWVRQEGIMSLEQAVRRLTFESASTFGIYDRGLLRPGLAADITIFDPETVNPLPEDTVHDFPAGGWRVRELAAGDSLYDRQWAGAARRRAPYGGPPRTRPAQYALRRQRLRLTAGTARYRPARQVRSGARLPALRLGAASPDLDDSRPGSAQQCAGAPGSARAAHGWSLVSRAGPVYGQGARQQGSRPCGVLFRYAPCAQYYRSHLQGRGREDRTHSGDRATHRHARMLTGHMHPRLPVRPGSPAYACARNIQSSPVIRRRVS